jgi:hypothetical protein
MESEMSNESTIPSGEPEPVVQQGEKLYVTECSITGTNTRHHFAGEVTGISGDVVRLDGYDFVYGESSGTFTRNPWRWKRIIRLDNAFVFFVLPEDCKLDEIHLERDGTELIITQGGSFLLVDTAYSSR